MSLDAIKATFQASIDTKTLLVNDIERLEALLEVAGVASSTLKAGHKMMLCGNGGSAADSQHIAAELIGRFEKERQSMAAIALTTDTICADRHWQMTMATIKSFHDRSKGLDNLATY